MINKPKKESVNVADPGFMKRLLCCR